MSGNRVGGYFQARKGRFETACASLWHGQGMPAREIGDRVGQRQISTTLDVYTHVLISPEEVSEEAYRAALVVSPWCLD